MNSKKIQVLTFIIAVLALLISLAPGEAKGRPPLNVTNFDSIHLADNTGTATPVLLSNQTGNGALIEVQDSGTMAFQVANGGIADFNANQIDLDADNDTSITADTDDQIDFEAGGSDVGYFSGLGLTVNNVLNTADTDSALTGAQTITPTYSYLQTSPTTVLTITLATGSAVDGDILIIHNLVSTTTTVVDTTATAGGGDVTIGQDDIGAFIFGDGVWIELFSPDNS